MKILVVDDNLDIIKLLTKVFSVKGHEVRSITNGKDGLELIKNEEWDTILLDIAMPELSGLEVIDDLEKNNLLKKSSVWIFSASSITDEEVNELVERGVAGIIRKPIKLKDLFAKITKLKTTR
jgi:two-component system OmpR family response regulator